MFQTDNTAVYDLRLGAKFMTADISNKPKTQFSFRYAFFFLFPP